MAPTISRTLTLLGLLGLLSACGGGGGGGNGEANAAPPVTPVLPSTNSLVPAVPNNNASVTSCPTAPAIGTGTPSPTAALKGRVTFDRIPFFSAPNTYVSFAPGLDYANPRITPARGVVVEAVASSGGTCEGNVLDTTVTDGDGWYALNANLDQAVCVRARVQLYRSSSSGGAGWDISVVDNTDGNKLYVMADSRFTSARSEPRRDLHAASGWSGGSYNTARVAAPFAIADTACKALDAILSVQPSAQFGDMTFRWSTRNTESSGALADGKIGGAFFSATAQAVYLRGDAATNTDEFDEMVIAHEFGHFVTHRFSRSDSIGGDHSLLDYLDPRVAFDEGWATAFAGLVLQSRVYRDSDEVATPSSPSREFYFFIDDSSVWLRGWYAESAVQSVIYAAGETTSNDGVALGFGPIWSTMIGTYKNTASLQTLFSFASALKAANPNDAGGLANLLNNQQISGDSINEFASTETHAPDTARDLPVYRTIDTSTVRRVCSTNGYNVTPYAATDSPNKLSMKRFLRFDVPAAGSYRITVTPERPTGLAGLSLFTQGRSIGCASGSSNIESLIAGTAVSLRCNLQSSTYVLAVYQTDFSNDSNAQQANYDQCFLVKAEAQ